MSNHYHLVITDCNGRLPEFQQHLNSLLARAVNCARGRWEAFWSRDSYNAVELLEPDAVLDKLAYTLLNPVRGGLVGRATAWEVATSASLRFGAQRFVTRPTDFFSEDMPDQAALRLVAPPLDNQLELDVQLAARVEAGEREVRTTGCRPMGMTAVLGQHWNDSPATRAPRRRLVPRFAGRCTAVRIAAIVELRHWVELYRTAFAFFKEGKREVGWPAGTYRMCARLGCPAAAG
jgi:hypothetical protein